MSESLRVIALISGGKDSLFSILHCLKNEHTVVALANLYPKPPGGRTSSVTSTGNDEHEGEGEDLNSFMYQTVGHSVIPLYSDCLGIPLYRRQITGSAVQTGRYYDASNIDGTPDETEDLIPLLQEILREHPEANAVCSGAILSTYQRTRVESVALRLDLIPLSYLWQYPALPPPADRADSLTGLLEDMRHAGCDARIIKIASGGIKENLLGANVADPKTQSRLVTGLRPFYQENQFWLRAAVVGEGGEYESLAVDGPPNIWRKRIELEPDKDSTFSGEGGVTYLRVGKARTVKNETTREPSDLSFVRQPGVYDTQFDTVLKMLESESQSSVSSNDHNSNPPQEFGTYTFSHEAIPTADNLTSSHLSISNMTAVDANSSAGLIKAAEQIKQIGQDLVSALNSISKAHHLSTKISTSNIVSSTLLLRDISNFAFVNSQYSALFRTGEPNPPARVTLACGLPDGVEVSMSVVLDLGPRSARRGLHVQSRSYWAPANIGPYSQAICVPIRRGEDVGLNVHDAALLETVHMAGQIPLDPHTMQIPVVHSPSDYVNAAVLGLQHLWRIGQEREVDMWPWGVAFLKQGPDTWDRASTASRIWKETHRIGTRPEKDLPDEDDGSEERLDAWDLRYNRFSSNNSSTHTITVGEHLHELPTKSVFGNDIEASLFIPPFIAAEVTSLPRDASVEWWSLGIAHLSTMQASGLRASPDRKEFAWGSLSKVDISYAVQDSLPGTHVHMVTVFIKESSTSNVDHSAATAEIDLCNYLLKNESFGESASSLAKSALELIHGTAYVSALGQTEWCRMSRQSLFAKLTVIPCRSVYGQSDFDSVDKTTEPVLNGGNFNASGQRPSHVTSREKGAALSQPLAMALTMRIDSVGHT